MALAVFIITYLLARKFVFFSNIFIGTLGLVLYITIIVIFLGCIEDFVGFMILFETLLVPLIFAMVAFAFTNRFIFALHNLIAYSCIGAVLLLISLIVVVFHLNIFSYEGWYDIFFDSMFLGGWIWFCLFTTFAVKYPIYPFHSWLPEVHVEASTEKVLSLGEDWSLV
jgi:NADH-quinone oxidoreductase subunit M